MWNNVWCVVFFSHPYTNGIKIETNECLVSEVPIVCALFWILLMNWWTYLNALYCFASSFWESASVEQKKSMMKLYVDIQFQYWHLVDTFNGMEICRVVGKWGQQTLMSVYAFNSLKMNYYYILYAAVIIWI